MNKILPTLLLLSVTTPGFALKSDANQLAHITADSVQYSNKTGIAKYVGHVHARQGSTKIDADQITLHRDANNDISKIVALGKPARYSTLPDGQKSRFHANANTIEFYPQRGKVHLIKNGLAILGKNRFTGPLIRYDINQQLVESDPSPEGQTTIVLEPSHHHPTTKATHS